MRIPEGLEPLLDYGVLDDVLRPLMSGKEAQVYLVVSSGKVCVAKVYKSAQNRSFKNRAEYTEGRSTRNSRDQRAIGKRSKHGRAQDEAAWRSTEVDIIHRLYAAGVRVPVPHHFVEGVLLMELVCDREGNPAPRLGDLRFSPEQAKHLYDRLIVEVQRMLCAGVVHGDLSDFNVLVSGDGPVIIDFPQSVDTARNPNARKLLVRDVENLHHFLRRWVPNARRLPYAEEMWELHEQNLLTPETRLEGRVSSRRAQTGPVNTEGVLALIRDADEDERRRRGGSGANGRAGASADSGSRDPSSRQGINARPEPEPPAPAPAPMSRYAQKMAQRRAEMMAAAQAAPPAPAPTPRGPAAPGRPGAPPSAGAARPHGTARPAGGPPASPSSSRGAQPSSSAGPRAGGPHTGGPHTARPHGHGHDAPRPPRDPRSGGGGSNQGDARFARPNAPNDRQPQHPRQGQPHHQRQGQPQHPSQGQPQHPRQGQPPHSSQEQPSGDTSNVPYSSRRRRREPVGTYAPGSPASNGSSGGSPAPQNPAPRHPNGVSTGVREESPSSRPPRTSRPPERPRRAEVEVIVKRDKNR